MIRFLQIGIILLCLCLLHGQKDDLNLKAVIKLIRHGARKSIHKKFQLSEEQKLGKDDHGDIIRLGAFEQYNLGRELQEKYSKIFPALTLNDIITHTSYTKRTIDSAYFYLIGYFSDELRMHDYLYELLSNENNSL